jgi:hypothetical protein
LIFICLLSSNRQTILAGRLHARDDFGRAALEDVADMTLGKCAKQAKFIPAGIELAQ